jgi:hypothetical protein
MKLTRRFAQLTPEKRPQDPNMDGTGLRFETMEHGGEYPTPCPRPSKWWTRKAGPASTSRSRRTAEWSTVKDTCSIKRKINGQVPFGWLVRPLVIITT